MKSRVAVAAVLSAAVAFAAGIAAQQPPPAQPAAQRGGARGGGRGPAGTLLYNERCASCHGGNDGTAGSASGLFNVKWVDSAMDGAIQRAIRSTPAHGQAGGFTFDQLSDDQLFQIVQYIRTQAVARAPKPTFVEDPVGQVLQTEKQAVRVEVVARNLETPWGLAFLPDGRLLVTERPGHLRIVDHGVLSEPVKNTPTPHVQQDGGYLDVTVHPRFAENGWIYLSYSEVQPGFTPPPAGQEPPPPAGGGLLGRGRGPQIPSNTVIIRGRINARNEWTDQQVIFRAPSELYVSSGVHFGSRFTWDRTGHLFFSLGERGTMQNAQDLKSPLGKIHRVNDDGSVPADNPFVGRNDALGSIWSYGHRNPQGLTWNPVTGKLWESEHGPTGGDEINIIEPGRNYGWGVITMGTQPGITERTHAGMETPVVYFTPSIGPSGMTYYSGDRYPGWKNTSLFVGALVGQQLRRLETNADAVTHQEVVFNQFGRVHDIVTGPDGYFYVAVQDPTAGSTGVPMAASTPGKVLRLVPVSTLAGK